MSGRRSERSRALVGHCAGREPVPGLRTVGSLTRVVAGSDEGAKVENGHFAGVDISWAKRNLFYRRKKKMALMKQNYFLFLPLKCMSWPQWKMYNACLQLAKESTVPLEL